MKNRGPERTAITLCLRHNNRHGTELRNLISCKVLRIQEGNTYTNNQKCQLTFSILTCLPPEMCFLMLLYVLLVCWSGWRGTVQARRSGRPSAAGSSPPPCVSGMEVKWADLKGIRFCEHLVPGWQCCSGGHRTFRRRHCCWTM